MLAPKKSVAKAFPKAATEDVCREILKAGSVQVSAREREAKAEQLAKDISNLVASLVVDAKTGARLPPDSVARLLRAARADVPGWGVAARRIVFRRIAAATRTAAQPLTQGGSRRRRGVTRGYSEGGSRRRRGVTRG